MEAFFPIIIFCYNRPNNLKSTIQALQRNKLAKESELYIFSDGYKNEKDKSGVIKVRNLIRSIDGFKNVTIIERDRNFGLAKSVISGVSEMFRKFEKVIVLEDDIITANDFLQFMNKALNYYEKDTRIWSVTGYCPPIKIPVNYSHDVFLSLRPSSWGWGTWKDRWETIDWEIKDYQELLSNRKLQKAFNKGGNDLFEMLKNQMEGRIDSWAIRWSYNQFKYSKFSVYPIHTKIKHVGFGLNATHARWEKKKQLEINNEIKLNLETELVKNKIILKQMKKLHVSRLRLFLRNVTRLLGIYNFLFGIFDRIFQKK